jgi:hypothetical protein
MLAQSRLPLISALISFSASLAYAQSVPEKERTSLLLAAKSQYYNARAAGLKGFHCDVNVDWTAMFGSAGNASVDPNIPLIRYFASTHIGVGGDLVGKPKLEWLTTGVPPEGQEKTVDQMHGGMQQMVEGFFTAWGPALNGTIIPQKPASFEKTATGYVVVNGDSAAQDTLTLDREMKLAHIATKMDSIDAEMDTTFTTSPKGLLLTRMDSRTRQPPSSPAVHSIMSATFAPVDDFLLPSTLVITVTNVVTVPMKFENCTVTKQTQP